MPFGLRIRLGPNNRKIIRSLGADRARAAIQKGFDKYKATLLRELVEQTYQRTKTRGPMARGWRVNVAKDRIIVRNIVRGRGGKGRKPVAYAAFIEFGTRAHTVKPRHKKVLAWRTGGRGPISAANAKTRRRGGGAGALAGKNFAHSQGHRVSGIRARRPGAIAIRNARGDALRIVGSELDRALGVG